MYLDRYYLLLVVPALLLSLYAQAMVKGNFSKYSKVFTKKGLTAAEAARQILNNSGLYNVKIEHISGSLTDHFDPKAGVIRLSDAVYGSTSVASLGVAAHEAGHAVQHAKGYIPIKLRNAVLPVASFGSRAAVPLVILGLILQFGILIDAGIVFFAAATLFQVLTLPVEINASKRALFVLENGFLDKEEKKAAKKVLFAAALTYVAAMLTSLAQLVRLIMLTKNRRD